MTLAEAIGLSAGSVIWFISLDGTARRIRVNGAVKRWKREPDRFRVPIKYGMYEYGYFENVDLPRILVEITQPQ
jgi:hypothetical protein